MIVLQFNLELLEIRAVTIVRQMTGCRQLGANTVIIRLDVQQSSFHVERWFIGRKTRCHIHVHVHRERGVILYTLTMLPSSGIKGHTDITNMKHFKEFSSTVSALPSVYSVSIPKGSQLPELVPSPELHSRVNIYQTCLCLSHTEQINFGGGLL